MSIFKREKRNKYAKIPKKYKILFLKKVLQQKQPLKLTADLFKINYSTAKTLIRQYRTESLELDITEFSNEQSNYFIKKLQGLKRCSFKQVTIDQKEPETNLISFSIGQVEKIGAKSDKKIGYILTWPSKPPKTNAIEIFTKIQFP